MTITEKDYIKGIREEVDGINKWQPFQNKKKQINNLLQNYPEPCERDYIQKYSELQINVFNSRLGESSYVIALLAMVISVLILLVYDTQFFDGNEEIFSMFIKIDIIIIVYLIIWLIYIPFKKRHLKDIIIAIVEEKLLRKIQVNGFHSKNTYYECNELKELVDRAIKDELCIVFKNLKTEKCKYIQKVAEARSSWLGVQLNAIFFVAAFGFGLTTGLSFIDYKYLIGIIIVIPAYLCLKKWKRKYDVCDEIILNAEEKRLRMEIESKKISLWYMLPPFKLQSCA